MWIEDIATKAVLDNKVRGRLAYALVFLAGLVWIVSLWLRSAGTPFQDEIAHLLIARNAWNYPTLILDIWGRVGHTLLYMLPSLFGLDGGRLASVLLCCAIVLVTTGVARTLGVRHLALVPIFLWFQPWFGDLMYAAITQVPFTLLFILAVHEGLAGRLKTASMVFGLLPLVRHEGIALLGFWCLFLVVRREWMGLFIGVAPTILYNAVYLAVLHPGLSELPFAIYFKSRSSINFHRSGGWFYFVYGLKGVGKVVLVWAAAGLVPAWLQQRRRMLYLLLLYPGYFAVHTLIYHFGAYNVIYDIMDPGLYISPLAPAFAVLAALGADVLLNHVRRIFPVAIR